MCRNSNTVGRRDWKIGSIPPAPFHHPPIHSYTTSSPSSASPRFALSFSRPSPTSRDFASYSPRLRYKYLPIISRHTGQYHTSVRGLTTEESHPPRCISVQRESARRFSSVPEKRGERTAWWKKNSRFIRGRPLKVHRSSRKLHA